MNPTEALAGQLGDRLLTAEQVLKLPAPEWLVQDLLPRDGLGVMFGEPGSYKSFLALDLALCVSGGYPWGGREVKSGPAIYISGEGRSGFSIRLEAWMSNASVDTLPGFHLFPEALPLLDSGRLVPAFVELCRTMRPGIVVVDTLARSMAGGDENSTRDMGILMDSVDAIRRASGALVLLVHHTTKGGGSYRGSSALEGAADTMMEVTVETSTKELTVSCFKQKEADRFEDIHLHPKEVTVRGGALTSCVLNVSGAVRHRALKTLQETQLVSTMLEAPETTEWTIPEMVGVAGLSRANVYRTVKSLLERGFLLQTAEGYRARFKLNPGTTPRLRSEMSQEVSGPTLSSEMSHSPGVPIGDPGETSQETSGGDKLWTEECAEGEEPQ